MLDYLVLYESETGNTKKIATEIFSALPGMSKDLINFQERDHFPEALVYFVGFGVHQGTCSLSLGHFLSGLSDKNIALFGTCGAGNHSEYFRSIENSAKIWIEDDNHYLGAFFCQGKMPLSVRKKYEAMLLNSPDRTKEQLEKQLRNFDEAMVHPDRNDYSHADAFVRCCLAQVD